MISKAKHKSKKEQYKSSDEISCIILTKNRLGIVKNIVTYYAKWFNAIYVLDASENPKKESIESISEKADLYLLPGTSVYHRLNLAMEIVPTQYILLAPDDDIIMCSEVVKYRSRISEDHGLLYGDILSATNDNRNGIVFLPAWGWSSKFDISKQDSLCEKLYMTTRFIQTSRFFWTLYSKNHFVSLCKYLRKINRDIFSLEYAVSFFNLLHGNPFYTNNFLYIRNTLHDSVDKTRGAKKQQGNESAKEVYVRNKAEAISNFIKSTMNYQRLENFTEQQWNMVGRTILNVETNEQDYLAEFIPDIATGTIKPSSNINNARKFTLREDICNNDEESVKRYFLNSFYS